MNRGRAYLACAALIVGALNGAPHTAPAPAPAVECIEDMPCWDCSTMGNHICGPDDARPQLVAITLDEMKGN